MGVIIPLSNIRHRATTFILAQFLPSATKLRRLCFYRCVSVHTGGGVCLSACWDTTAPGVDTPPEQTSLGADTPPPRSRHPPGSRHPQSRHPWEQTPPPTGSRHSPRADTPPGADLPTQRQPLLRTVRILLECILVSILCCALRIRLELCYGRRGWKEGFRGRWYPRVIILIILSLHPQPKTM